PGRPRNSVIQLNRYGMPASSIKKPRPCGPSPSSVSPTRMAPVITGPKLGSKRRGTIFPFLRSLLLMMNERRSPLTEKRVPSKSRFNPGNASRFFMSKYGEPKVPAETMRRLQWMVNRGGGEHLPVDGSIVSGMVSHKLDCIFVVTQRSHALHFTQRFDSRGRLLVNGGGDVSVVERVLAAVITTNVALATEPAS